MVNNTQNMTNLPTNTGLDLTTTINSATQDLTTTRDQQLADELTMTAQSSPYREHGLSASNIDKTTLESQTLELLAERPVVNIERVVTGNVKLSKQVRTQTVNVPVTLTQEVLVVEYNAVANVGNELSLTNGSDTHLKDQTVVDRDLVTVVTLPADKTATQILVNGKPLTLTDAPTEIVISQQVANVSISTNVVEEIHLTTQTQSHEQTIPVTLRHEELVVDETKLDTAQLSTTQHTMDKPWFDR